MLLYLVEGNMTGSEHSGVNAAILRACVDLSPHTQLELHLWCEPDHHETISKGLQVPPNVSIYYHEIVVVPGSRRHFVWKVAVEIYNLINILRRAKKEKATTLVLSTSAPATALLFSMRFMFRSVTTHLILHGLDGLQRGNRWKLTSYAFWNRLALLHSYDGRWPMAYVLGDGIRMRLIEGFPYVKSLRKILSIEHPYDFGLSAAQYRPREAGEQYRRPMRIGFLGFGRKDKGIDKFYSLAARMADLVSSAMVEFVLAGTLRGDCAQYRNRWVTELRTDSDVLRTSEGYLGEICRLDCAVFLNASAYSLTASGSVLDAIAAGVKIISLPNPYVADMKLFDTEGGVMVVDDIDEMEKHLRADAVDGNFRRRFAFSSIRDRHSIRMCSEMLISRIGSQIAQRD